MSWIGDIFAGGEKIGEIWTDDGDVLGGLITLFLIAIPISVIVGIVMGSIWLWNAGSNLMSYGTIDEQLAKERAIARIEAPIKADPRYYTNLTSSAKITIVPPTRLESENSGEYNHYIYFNLDTINDDNKDHSVYLQITVTADWRDWRFTKGPSSVRVITFSPDVFFIPAHRRVTNKIVYKGGGNIYENIRNFRYSIITIDGLPAIDPRTTLSKFTIEYKLLDPPLLTSPFSNDGHGNSDFNFQIKVTNGDSLPHMVRGSIDYESTYIFLGEVKKHSDTGTLFYYGEGKLKAGESTVALGRTKGSDNRLTVPGLPNQVRSITLKQLVLTLADDSKLPSSVIERRIDLSQYNYTFRP